LFVLPLFKAGKGGVAVKLQERIRIGSGRRLLILFVVRLARLLPC
jgi:hypothetical protein